MHLKNSENNNLSQRDTGSIYRKIKIRFFSLTKQLLLFISIIGNLIFFVNCSKQSGGITLSAPGSTEASGAGTGTGTTSNSGGTGASDSSSLNPTSLPTKVLNFKIDDSLKSKVDILFVIDNSGSMRKEHLKTSYAFSNFLESIANIDWRIAITTTDTSEIDGEKGRILPFTSERYYLKKADLDANSLFTKKVNVGIDGSGDENGLSAIDLFMDLAKDSTTNEHAFLRPDSMLASIILSDSDEMQDQDSNFRTNLGKFFYNSFKNAYPNRLYKNYSIISLPNDEACKSTSEEYGQSYFTLSQLTGGVSLSKCEEKYGDHFKNIGANIDTKSVSSKLLECDPIDTNKDDIPDVRVVHLTTNTEVTKIQLVGNLVSFTPALSAAGDYRITYTCKVPEN